MVWRFSLRGPQLGSSGSFSFCALPIFLIPSSNPFMQTNYIGRSLYLVLQDKLMAPQKLLLTESSDRASVQNCTQRISPAFPPGSERSPRGRDTESQVALRLCKVKAGTQKGLCKLESICGTASKRQSDSVFQMLLAVGGWGCSMLLGMAGGWGATLKYCGHSYRVGCMCPMSMNCTNQ